MDTVEKADGRLACVAEASASCWASVQDSFNRLQNAVERHTEGLCLELEEAVHLADEGLTAERRRRSMAMPEEPQWPHELSHLDTEMDELRQEKLQLEAHLERLKKSHLAVVAEQLEELVTTKDKLQLMRSFSGLKWVEGPMDGGLHTLKLVKVRESGPQVLTVLLTEAEWNGEQENADQEAQRRGAARCDSLWAFM
ncbi:MAG: hypothetical protein KVP17_001816 [Porospora cf. gigantea B]|uniref:uncharacterized protein n=1 Tax=Porospora cf. gigantea B TaxID=2853592 RepID=UPI003571B74B|nr:MAG: hypothetical protein KVP17_001816 [Porospora cf. gigantea B]